MRRREFITLLGGAAAWPVAARAQKVDKVYRVAIFSTTGRDRVWHLHKTLIESLRGLGYVEGQNVVVENRFAEGSGYRASPLSLYR